MVGVCLAGGYVVIASKVKSTQMAQQQDMQVLMNKTGEQDAQLRDINARTAELIERQVQLQQEQLAIAQEQKEMLVPQIPSHVLDDAIAAIHSDMDALDPEETGEKIKSWIEQT